MKIIITLIILLTLSACHVTGHNQYGDNAVFNGIMIGSIVSLIKAQTN
jgi:hypothetical protein